MLFCTRVGYSVKKKLQGLDLYKVRVLRYLTLSRLHLEGGMGETSVEVCCYLSFVV